MRLSIYDLRDEADYNHFHIADARRTTIGALEDRAPELLAEPAELLGFEEAWLAGGRDALEDGPDAVLLVPIEEGER